MHSPRTEGALTDRDYLVLVTVNTWVDPWRPKHFLGNFFSEQCRNVETIKHRWKTALPEKNLLVLRGIVENRVVFSEHRRGIFHFFLSLEPIFWPLVEGDWTRITSKGFLFLMYYDRDIAFLMCTTFLDSPKIHVSRVDQKCNISVIVHQKKKSFGGYSSSVSLYQWPKYGL